MCGSVWFLNTWLNWEPNRFQALLLGKTPSPNTVPVLNCERFGITCMCMSPGKRRLQEKRNSHTTGTLHSYLVHIFPEVYPALEKYKN